MPRLQLDTPVGRAEAELDPVRGADLLLVLGHGSGGSVEAPDLLSVRTAAVEAGIAVARVTQPYRVLGRKAPPSAASLDAAWAAVVAALTRRPGLRSTRLVFGGRSAGARVACRGAAAADPARRPVAVVALAFPLHPPGKPDKSRLPELAAVPVPTLVVQGRSDPFGQPPAGAGRTVLLVEGDHSLKRSAAEVGPRVVEWLSRL